MRVGWRFRNGKYTSERTAWSSVTSEEGVLEAVIAVPSAIVPALLPDKSLDNVFYQNRGVNQERRYKIQEKGIQSRRNSKDHKKFKSQDNNCEAARESDHPRERRMEDSRKDCLKENNYN